MYNKHWFWYGGGLHWIVITLGYDDVSFVFFGYGRL